MTILEAARFIKIKYYHELNAHQKHFVKYAADARALRPDQEKFIFWLAKRFNIYIEKVFFRPKFEKPSLPNRVIEDPYSTKERIALRPQNESFWINTGLGAEFDRLAVVDNLGDYRPKPPYDVRFDNRPLKLIYGMKSRSGIDIGSMFLEMISYSSKDRDERAKVSAFLLAMNQEPSEDKPPTVQPKRGPRKKGLKERIVPDLFERITEYV